jgi:hypothetical protein
MLFLITVSLAVALPTIHAQSTSISELSYPPGMAGDSFDPVTVTATVTYRDADPGYTLLVGILDMDRPSADFVPGIATGSPGGCLNQPVLLAWCVSRTQGSSGVEHLEFRIGGILGGNAGVESWNLNMTAALYDANNTLVHGSVSSVPFRIALSPMTLEVLVPAGAVVWVDGVKQQAGPVQLPIGAGTHNVTVPEIVQVDEGTRLRFDHWKDGPTQPNRIITVNLSESIEAVYVSQYLLTITGQTPSTQGGGWYDQGYVATYSTADTEQMSSLLGLLGGKLTFQGWYENNNLLSDSSIDNIIMNNPHTLTLVTQADYTMPIAILGGLAGSLVVAAYLIFRRKSAATSEKESRATRRKSPSRKSARSIKG